jgi:hypothetical protein
LSLTIGFEGMTLCKKGCDLTLVVDEVAATATAGSAG